MHSVLHDDRALIAEALDRIDAALRSGRLDPERRELQVLSLAGGRFFIGWSGRYAIAALRRAETTAPIIGRLDQGEAVVAAVRSAQGGRRVLAALMVRMLALARREETTE